MNVLDVEHCSGITSVLVETENQEHLFPLFTEKIKLPVL